jgi:hypothetical protein
MGWRVPLDRFLVGDRCWLPSWRFLKDAMRLLEQVVPEGFIIVAANFIAMVRITSATGEARNISKPQAISYAVAREFGIALEAN